MYDPFSPDFDPVAALQRTPSGDEEDAPGSLDDAERALARDLPEVARLICEIDKQEQQQQRQQPPQKSKKQEKRERLARLEKMCKPGRTLFEKPSQLKGGSVDLDSLHSQWSIGPMSLLHRALKENIRVEVHIRALNRVDRIARGYPIAFDKHINVVLRDVDEVALPGRKEERAFGRRQLQERLLPIGMRWQPDFDSYAQLKVSLYLNQ
ncbi:hypothetical protein Y032_0191g1285 [Ancylostoma ceylanicum]|uniref:LSM domain-containing protein n=1 Tax=Ancylostoma ceylanicum TaxID=53326 RepID=A0A016SQJ7_9BILA|nr:hypothetical protein Y032_0191g1285 [Ancylostoma ceylanicum]